MSTTTAKRDTRDRRDGGSRKLGQRHVPFTALLLMPPLAYLVGLVLHLLTAGFSIDWLLLGWLPVRWTVTGSRTAIGLTCGFITLAGCGLALVAHQLGTSRKPIIRRMLVGSIIGYGIALAATVALGHNRWWALAFILGGETIALVWCLPRLDALRQDKRDEGEDDGWGKVFGIPHTKVGAPTVDERGNVHVKLTAGRGETVKDAQAALSKIESAAGALADRSRIVRDDAANVSELVLVRNDPFKTWQPWPGLSRPGGSYGDGLRTAYYDTGEHQWYWLASGSTPDGDPRPAGHIGRMGMSRSGKSGDSGNELAEVFSRRDAVVLYADDVKGAQSAGWALEFLTGYADTDAKAKTLFKAVQGLVTYRTDQMGRYGYRDWSAAVYDDPRLRFAAVHYFIDEADTLINTEVFKWLATKALSTGVFLSVALPRADHEAMPTTARFSIAQWKCFGVGDDYSAAFALTDGTRAAGAAPESWRVSKPGAHFLDTAPGVDPSLYPVPCRSYRSDHAALAAEVRQARAGFAPATFTDAELDAGGGQLRKALAMCAPANARVYQTDAASIEAATDQEHELGEDVEVCADDDELRVPRMRDMDAREEREFHSIDPRRPIERGDAAEVEFVDEVPRPRTAEEMAAEFDRRLVEMAGEGVTEFRNRDLWERCRRWRSETWFSRRLSAVAEGEIVAPPGLTLQRLAPGHYKIIFEAVGSAV